MIKIFNGVEEVEVGNGSMFDLPGVWTWEIGEEVIFQIDDEIELITRVANLSGTGTTFETIAIEAKNTFAETKIEAVDVDDVSVNTEENIENIIEIEINKKTTKKQLVEYIDTYNLDIDKKLSKKNMIEAFNNYEGVKIV